MDSACQYYIEPSGKSAMWPVFSVEKYYIKHNGRIRSVIDLIIEYVSPYTASNTFGCRKPFILVMYSDTVHFYPDWSTLTEYFRWLSPRGEDPASLARRYPDTPCYEAWSEETLLQLYRDTVNAWWEFYRNDLHYWLNHFRNEHEKNKPKCIVVDEVNRDEGTNVYRLLSYLCRLRGFEEPYLFLVELSGRFHGAPGIRELEKRYNAARPRRFGIF